MTDLDFEVLEIDAPAHWASALIDGDYSGLEDEDEKALNEWLDNESEGASLFWCVDCSEEPFIARFNGLQTEMATYTFHVRSTKS